MTRTRELSPDDVIDGALPLERALATVIEKSLPVRPVALGGSADGDSGTGALFDRDVRNTWQDADLENATRPVAELARPDGVASDEATALRLLAEHAGWPGVLLDDGSGRVRTVERALPRVRRAVLMAGGFGKRLRPLTENKPKPLLEVGGEPLIGRILALLARHGVQRVTVSVHYCAEQVRAAVGDGSAWGVEVDYLDEDQPLGTGAGLVLLRDVDEPFFLINGDILTSVDLDAMAREHHVAGNLATVATFRYPAPLPYGVVHHDGARIVRIEEKPVFRYPINAGLYLFDPRVLGMVTPGEPLAMVDFLNELAPRERVGRFALVEYWNDVGSHADYERAQEEVHDL